jgi:putative spermidine/putrescine transport system permease protein
MAVGVNRTRSLTGLPGVRPSRLMPGPTFILLAPCVAFLLVLFVIPVAYVLVLSVTDPSLSLLQFERVFSTPLYLHILWRTFFTALLVTVICLVLGYPLAYAMARRTDAWSRILLGLVAMSFWTGFLVRTYAWLVILGNRGPLISLLTAFGVGSPPRLLFNSFSSTIGMTHILLPYMVLALYSVMKKFDASYLRAAESLGATPLVAFKTVFVPLSMPGVVNGSVLVFTICLGFYVTPILLGGTHDMMISQLINQQIEELLNWGFASALSVVLLAVTAIVLGVYNRLIGLDKLWG